MVLAAVLAATTVPASAEIIFQYGVTEPLVRYHSGFSSGGMTMSTILMAPNAGISPQVSYQMQRARAWSNYRREDSRSGGSLVYAPALAPFGAYAGNGVSSYGQAVARAHVSRANGYRLGYYK